MGLLVFLALTDSEGSNKLDRPAASDAIDTPRCTSQARLVENVKTYEFYGARTGDAAESLRQRLLVTNDFEGRQRRFTGQTDWHIEWRACFEPQGIACRIGGVVSTVNVTYTLPHWADRDGAPHSARGKWDRYLESLIEHEKGHGRIALEIGVRIGQELVGLGARQSCEVLGAEAARVVEEVMQQGEAQQREYDRLTAHGSLQGAHFPF
jgi:predicted secreted Zn-dependent protease